jgi:hypothetical protein
VNPAACAASATFLIAATRDAFGPFKSNDVASSSTCNRKLCSESTAKRLEFEAIGKAIGTQD